MSLSRKTADAVKTLASAMHIPTSLGVEDGDFRLTLNLGLVTAVGVECQGLDFATLRATDLAMDDLKARAGRLAARLTYLMEPLSVLEADPVAGLVVVRSTAPSLKPGRRTYYEARLSRHGGLTFERIVFHEAERRRTSVPFQLTTETLERLVDDLAATSA